MKWTIGKGISPFIRSGGGTSWSSYWATQPEVLFFGLYSEISGGQMLNKVTGATDFLTVAGVAGSETYQAPHTAPYETADTDYIWFDSGSTQRTVTTTELIGYDFARTIVYYGNTSPYSIVAIIILNSALSTAKMNKLRDDFDLSIWWSGVLSSYGNLKGNRGPGQSIYTPYQVETNNLVNRMVAAGETPTDARKIIINTAIAALKANLLWTKLDGLWLMAAHGTASAKLNWISSSYTLTLEGTVPSTFAADLGYTGTGSDKIRTGLNPSSGGFKYIQDSAMVSFYSRTASNGGALSNASFAAAGAAPGYIGNTAIYPRYSDNKAYFRLNGGVEVDVASTNGSGLFTVIRDSSTTLKFYKDKSQTAKSTNSDGLPPEIVLDGANTGGTIISTMTTRQHSLLIIGESFSQTQQGLLYDILVDGYLVSVGAKI